MVQFIPARNSWSEAFQQIGQGASQGYMNRTDEKALQKSIEGLGSNPTARQILDAITKTKTYSPAAKQNVLKNYLGVQEFEELQRKNKEAEDIAKAKNIIEQNKLDAEENKKKTERDEIRNIVNQLNLPDDQKKSLGDNISRKGAEDLLKNQLKPAEPSRFDNKIADRMADQYVDLSVEIPKLESRLEDINYARKLSNEIGLLGTVASNVGLSKKGKELEGVTFPLIEPILKMLAPSGAIAKEKLLRAESKYAISGSDAPWLREAKLDALERFTKQALNRAKEKQKLILEYDSKVPDDVINRFEKESESLSDAMLDYDLYAESVELPMKPDEFKGKTITSPDGQKYYSDGTRWVKR